MHRLTPGPRALVVLAAVLYLLPLARALPLIDPDEGLHAAIALEMSERGDLVVPRFLGSPFLDKPILFFFAQAESIRAFGASEFAVRAPGQVFGFLGALTTGLLAGAVAGKRVGLTAACVYATLALPVAIDQAPVHDVALVPWTNLALLGFIRALDRPSALLHVLRWCALSGVALGLAILTKGLTGVALVGLPVAIWALRRRAVRWPIVGGAAASLAIAFALAAPWYLAVERVVPGYLHYFFVERHLLGFATTTQVHGWRPWWYYLPVLAAGSFPWIATVSLAWHPRYDLVPELATLRRLSTLWLVAGFVFLSTAGSKLVTYILPLFPAVACLVAVSWTRNMDYRTTPRGQAFLGSLRLQFVLGATVVVALLIGIWQFLVTPVTTLPWLGPSLIAVGWLGGAMGAQRLSARQAFSATLVLVVGGLVALYAGLLPAVAVQLSARDLAAHFNAQGSLPSRLLIVDQRIGSFVYYLDPRLRQGLTPERVEGVPFARALLQGGAVPGTVVAVPPYTLARLARRIDIDRVAFERAGQYRLYRPDALRHAPLKRGSP